MNRHIVHLALGCWLLAAAVSSESRSRGAPLVSPEVIVINEVFYGGAAAADWVELRNTSGETLDIGSWWLCSRFDYVQLSGLTVLSGDLILGPGEIVVVGRFDIGGGSLSSLDDQSADLGLYTSSSFGSAAAMVDFVQWGTSLDVGRSDVAATKMIWTELSMSVYDFVPTAGSGESLAFCGAGGGLNLSSDFDNESPSQGSADQCAIFVDGFESGNTSSWTSEQP